MPKITEDINIDLMEYIKQNQKQKTKRTLSEEDKKRRSELLKKAREVRAQNKLLKTENTKTEHIKEVKIEPVKVEPIKEQAPKDMNSELLKGIYELLKSQQAKPTATPQAKPTATPQAKPTPTPQAKPTATPQEIRLQQIQQAKPQPTPQQPKPQPTPQQPKPAPVPQIEQAPQFRAVSTFKRPIWFQ
jgi:hypothetical protein